jgi:fructuronate reductase
LAVGASIDVLALGVAGWMRYATGLDEAGRPYKIKDPMAARLGDVAAAAGPNAQRLAQGLLQMSEIFGPDLPQDSRFTQPVTAALQRLFEHGAAHTVRDYAGRS